MVCIVIIGEVKEDRVWKIGSSSGAFLVVVSGVEGRQWQAEKEG